MSGKQQNDLDAVDRKILTILQTNGRITNVKLASDVGLSPPTVLERVRKLEEAGVIDRYVALVDADAVGCGLVAYIQVSLAFHKPEQLGRFREEMSALPEVLECYHVAGQEDYLLKVVERDIKALRDLLVNKLTGIPGVQRVNTMIVFETLKRETRLPIDSDESD
jgi:Lrp/AsnC family leucine-responsive transcriptional regulator